MYIIIPYYFITEISNTCTIHNYHFPAYYRKKFGTKSKEYHSVANFLDEYVAKFFNIMVIIVLMDCF